MKKHLTNYLAIAVVLVVLSFLIVLVEHWITPLPNLYDSITDEIISSIPYFIFGILLYWVQYHKEKDKK